MPLTRFKPTLVLASLAVGSVIAVGGPASSAAAEDTTFCGTPVIDEINVNETTWAEYSEQSGFYDDKIARFNALTGLQERLGMSRGDFCAAANQLIKTGAEEVLLGGLRKIMIGETGGLREYLFEQALSDSIEEVSGGELPDRIPPVGAGSQVGLTVSDSHLGGTDGSVFPSAIWGQQEGSYWYSNGVGLAVECVTSGPAYEVKWLSGLVEQWSTYVRVTDGRYVKSAAVEESTSDSDTFGLPEC